MEGDGQRQLQSHLSKAADARDQSAGGQGDMPHPDVQPVRVVYQLQKPQHRVQIVQRLSNPHQHNVGHRLPGIQLGEDHLIQNLGGRQIPDLSRNGGRAEGTAHPTAHLGGDAHGVAVAVPHENGFHTVAVRQLPQVFDGPVQPGDLLPGRLRHGKGICPRQLLPEALGDISHLVIGFYPLMQPGKHLLAPKGRFSHGPQCLRQLREGH